MLALAREVQESKQRQRWEGRTEDMEGKGWALGRDAGVAMMQQIVCPPPLSWSDRGPQENFPRLWNPPVLCCSAVELFHFLQGHQYKGK